MKKHLIYLFIVVATLIVLVGLVFYTSGVDGTVEMLSAMNYAWIAAALVCMMCYWFGDALSLYYIVRRFYTGQSLGSCIRISMVGAFFNSITPFSSGGQPAQLYMMSGYGINPGRSLSIAFVRSMVSQSVIVTYSAAVILLRGGYFAARVSGFYVLYLLGFLINAGVLVMYLLMVYKNAIARKIISWIYYALRKLKFLKNINKYEEKLTSEMEAYKECSIVLKSDYKLFLKVALVQVFRQTFFYSIPFFIYLAIEGKDTSNFLNMIAAQSMVATLSSITPSPGASGGAEGAGYVFFSLFFKTVPLIQVLLIWRLITHYSALIFGGVVTLVTGKMPRKKPRKE
ncbi:MAG: lysylphosphatidylglycerol synthase transmembrane domain-containing protein [Eubacteriales bacterium]|nr:lysylphosphatidylglycerol synthase transmembrane domain-containing protein [Eubacteriales bacterium]